MYTKYPSTPHLPFSPGMQRDDTRISSLNSLEGREVVITEKMDGENTTMYADHIHARSVDSRHHPSRDWVKNFWNSLRMDIPNNFRLCGENVYARHSVSYNSLETYFYGFSVWDDHRCLSWDDTLEFFELLGITPVPVIYRGVFDVKAVEQIANNFDVENKEGFVVRVAEDFSYNQFDTHVAKWVRAGHVQTDKHWMHGQVKPNQLKV
jgi:ATP-dependent RNA circularization protein (DNA/RNA ligase family)